MKRMNETKTGRKTLIKNGFKYAIKQYTDFGWYINNIYYENDKPTIYYITDIDKCDLFSKATANRLLEELNKNERKFKIVKVA